MKFDFVKIVLTSWLLLLFIPAGKVLSAEPHSDLPQIAPRDVPLLPLPTGGRKVAVSTAEELAAPSKAPAMATSFCSPTARIASAGSSISTK